MLLFVHKPLKQVDILLPSYPFTAAEKALTSATEIIFSTAACRSTACACTAMIARWKRMRRLLFFGFVLVIFLFYAGADHHHTTWFRGYDFVEVVRLVNTRATARRHDRISCFEIFYWSEWVSEWVSRSQWMFKFDFMCTSSAPRLPSCGCLSEGSFGFYCRW